MEAFAGREQPDFRGNSFRAVQKFLGCAESLKPFLATEYGELRRENYGYRSTSVSGKQIEQPWSEAAAAGSKVRAATSLLQLGWTRKRRSSPALP
jgi:hypothetical protein